MRRVSVFMLRTGAFGVTAAAAVLRRLLVPIAMILDGIVSVAGAAAPARGSGLRVRTDVRHDLLSFALPLAPPTL